MCGKLGESEIPKEGEGRVSECGKLGESEITKEIRVSLFEVPMREKVVDSVYWNTKNVAMLFNQSTQGSSKGSTWKEQFRPPNPGVSRLGQNLDPPEGGQGHDQDLGEVGEENMMVTQQQAEGLSWGEGHK